MWEHDSSPLSMVAPSDLHRRVRLLKEQMSASHLLLCIRRHSTPQLPVALAPCIAAQHSTVSA